MNSLLNFIDGWRLASSEVPEKLRVLQNLSTNEQRMLLRLVIASGSMLGSELNGSCVNLIAQGYVNMIGPYITLTKRSEDLLLSFEELILAGPMWQIDRSGSDNE